MQRPKISDAELRQRLTPKQYAVLRQKGTEAPFSGEFVTKKADGTYSCAVCDAVLFNTASQYESTMPGLMGWPSFAEVVDSDMVELKEDNSQGMHRTEVICKTCGSHLGHLFDGDPDSPSGKHYCINSVALNFNKKEANSEDNN